MTDRRNLLVAAFDAEVHARSRRAFLVALGASVVGGFALGASVLPIEIGGDLLLSYGVFLAVFGAVLCVMLVTQYGGDFGDALAVAVWARLHAEDEWQRLGAGRIPIGREQAEAWLAAHPDEATLRAQRLSAQLSAGRLEEARRTLETYPTATPYQRFDQAVDGWILDFVEGRQPALNEVEALAREIDSPDERMVAESSLALARAYLAVATGGDPMAVLAAARPELGDRAAGLVGSRYVLRTWTIVMTIAAGLVGVALLVGRATGVWS